MCFVKRTHGGASIPDDNGQAAPLDNRMTKYTLGKRRIAGCAAALLKDGQSVMLDGSSTAGFMILYIAKHKDITLFTNNMITAVSAINYGIKTHCIGGSSVNQSAVLSGEAAYRAAEGIHPDILFFSSHGIDKNGIITDPTAEENYIRVLMLKNAKQKVFLCDSDKFKHRALYTLTTADSIDACVFDAPFHELKTECKIITP